MEGTLERESRGLGIWVFHNTVEPPYQPGMPTSGPLSGREISFYLPSLSCFYFVLFPVTCSRTKGTRGYYNGLGKRLG